MVLEVPKCCSAKCDGQILFLDKRRKQNTTLRLGVYIRAIWSEYLSVPITQWAIGTVGKKSSIVWLSLRWRSRCWKSTIVLKSITTSQYFVIWKIQRLPVFTLSTKTDLSTYDKHVGALRTLFFNKTFHFKHLLYKVVYTS